MHALFRLFDHRISGYRRIPTFRSAITVSVLASSALGAFTGLGAAEKADRAHRAGCTARGAGKVASGALCTGSGLVAGEARETDLAGVASISETCGTASPLECTASAKSIAFEAISRARFGESTGRAS